MNVTTDPVKYIGKQCIVNSHGKRYYGKYDGMHGIISRPGSANVGVLLDGLHNDASGYGTFWFHKQEVELLKTVPLIDDAADAATYFMSERFNKEESKMETIKIVELAKARDLSELDDTKSAAISKLIEADDAVVMISNKREAEELTPLGYMQKLGMVCKETEQAIREEEADRNKKVYDIAKKYDELYAALALPEVNIIEVLKAAGVLNEDGTGLAKV